MSSGPDDGYFADGLTEEILNSLAQLPELLVTARTSAFHFKGKDIPVPEIASTLGVAHILEGSVRRDGDRLRVTAQLIRASDGFHLWSERYDHDTDSVFEVQADIAEKIAGVMNVVLDDSSLERMRATGIRNPEAYVALQKGRELYSQAHDGNGATDKLAEANIWFERVLELAPNFSDAHLLHSDLYAHTLINAATGADVTQEELEDSITKMRADLDAAIETAQDKPRQLNAAFNRGLLLGEWNALPALTAEIANTKSCVDPPWFDQATLGYGYEREHLAVEERNIACDPFSYGSWLGVMRSYVWLGEPDAAIETAQRAAEFVEHNLVDFNYFRALITAGRLDEARQAISTVLRIDRYRLRANVLLAAAIGDRKMVDQAMEEYLAANVIFDDQRVVMYATTGNRDAANAAAADIDARPFGHLLLMQIPSDCLCGAPFDLEHTPNFAQLLKDANLPWPPASPANWPLKDW
jgi:TolB-like protein